MNDNTERKQFEAAYRAQYPVACQSNAAKFLIELGEYTNTNTQIGWSMWQARAALSAPVDSLQRLADSGKTMPTEAQMWEWATERFEHADRLANLVIQHEGGSREGFLADVSAHMSATIAEYKKIAAPVNSTPIPPNSMELESVDSKASNIDRRDAERYRWLRTRLSAADFSYGDPPRCVLIFDWPKTVAVGGSCDQNIDAAIAQDKEPK